MGKNLETSAASSPEVSSRFRDRLAAQVAWLMLWPTLTVLLVVSAVYLDRMHALKDSVNRSQHLRVEAAVKSLRQHGRMLAAHFDRLQESEAVQHALAEETGIGRADLKARFNQILLDFPEYRRLLLLDADGEVIEAAAGAEVADSEVYIPLSEPPGAVQVPGVILVLAVQGGEPTTAAPSLFSFFMAVPATAGHDGGTLVAEVPGAALAGGAFSGGVGPEQEDVGLIDDDGTVLARLAIPDDTFFQAVGSGFRAPPFSGIEQSVLARFAAKRQGAFFFRGSFYAFSREQLFPDQIVFLGAGRSRTQRASGDPGEIVDTYLVSRIQQDYYAGLQKTYLRFLFLLSALLLIPSFVVCLFLARSRARVRREEKLRLLEHQQHLEQLEQKVKRRTRELGDSNLHLSAEIAERLSIEKQLTQTNELLEVMLESIDGIIYVADMESYEILYANEYLKTLFGFDPVGRRCWQFLHPGQEGPCPFCNNSRLLDVLGNPAPPCHWEYQNPFTKRWFGAKDQAILWSNGKYVRLEIAIDITEHKQLQHFLREARRQAETTIGARSRFVALVAHDLKSPFLSITRMLKRILDRESFDYDVHRQFLENIVENGNRMLEMIDNLLSMDRLETGEVRLEMTFFEAAGMVDEVLQNFTHPAREKGLQLINGIVPGSRIFADRYLYFVILNNLVSNALKFSDQGGEIEIYQPDPDRPMSLAVRDTGRGMTQEFADNLFKEDIKTTSRGTSGEKGSGLGLIFCRDIIEAHDGVIKVESKPGVGTTFYLELPECCNLDRE